MLEFIFELVFESICYPIGWFVWRVLTLGQYPKGGIFSPESDSKWADALISIVGMIAILVVGYFIF